MKLTINGITVVIEQDSTNINGKEFKTPPGISEAELMYLIGLFIALGMGSAAKVRAVDSVVDSLRKHLTKALLNQENKMNTQALIDEINANQKRARAKTQLTLGELIACLEAFPEDTKVTNLTCPHSYRGYYDDLAFEHAEGTRTAKSLLAECKFAIGREFEGYKGGDYVMDENTPVWLASYGECGAKLKALYADGSVEEEADDAYSH